MATALNLLIIDDDKFFGAQLAHQLTERDWLVSFEAYSNAVDADRLARHDAVLVDLNMPNRTGLQLIKEFREAFAGVMVVVSADGSHNAKKETLESGADFFMTKPVFIDELHWTLLRALQREASLLPAVECWALNAVELSLIGPGKVNIPLAEHEYAVLNQLTAAAPNPVSRPALIKAMGRDPREIKSRAIDVLLSRLKSRARDLGLALPIQAVRNQGYVFNGTLHDDDMAQRAGR